MDFVFVLFVFLAIILVTGGAYFFYAGQQEIVAAIWFMGSIGAMVFYGMRWFSNRGVKKGGEVGSWPPMINSCPDFLTLAKLPSGEPVCIDTVGVSRGGLPRINDPSTTTITSSNCFSLHRGKTGEQRAKALCDECKAKGVTWEGVYDGTSCMNVNPPLPPSLSS